MIKIKKYQIEDYISDATQDALDLKADLVNGKVPASQLPSFVDDVIEVANYAALPIPGATGVIYITLDTNKVYRWTGSVYVEIASGVTNLSYTPGVSNGTVNSDTGSDAIIPLAGTVNSGLFSATEKSKLDGIAPNANVGVIPNAPITGATKTKITYDNKGLVTAGADATTADIADSTNKRYVTDANLTVINNTSGTNTGDQNLQEVTDEGATTTNSITANSFIKSGGLSTEYLMADGSTTTGGGINHATASGTDTYTATVTGVTSYGDGDAYLIRFTIGNTTVATLNINALGAIPLYRNNDGPLIGGDVQANGEMLCVYNSTANIFQCIGTSPNSIISYVTNAEAGIITKGQVVYAFGGTGDRMTVKLASNIGDSTSAQTVGIVLSASIAANQKGFIIFQGLIDNLNILPTATWTDGDQVYLGVTSGSITKVKPYAPNHLVYIGIVTTASNGNAGRMYVRVQNGYELDELHNVQAQTPTLKDTLYYDNTVSPAQWKTSSISSILGYTPVNKAGDTMTGSLILNANPTVAFGAATKSYVDTLINGIDWKAAANAATTTSLPTYTVSGSGQILTGTVTMPATDGVTLTATQRLLVKSETSTLAPNNGIYVVTQVNPFILTRSSDANTPALLAEATISVSGGSTLSNTQWHCNPAAVPIVIGTTNIAFAGIGANAYTFTSPLINTSNVISVLNASGTQSGVVTTGTQTFGGAKTFTDNLTAGRYLYSGGSIFPEFGQTFYINGSGANHYFGGGPENVQNNVSIPLGNLYVGTTVTGTPGYGLLPNTVISTSGNSVVDIRNNNSTIISGDTIGTIQFSGKAEAIAGYVGAMIKVVAKLSMGSGNSGSPDMIFYTGPSGGYGSLVERMKLGSNGLSLNDETASTIASFDANKNIKSLTTANGYPSLTQLQYVSGVTSNIQTQLNYDASPIQRGAVTTGAQTFAGTKTFNTNPKIPINGGNSGAGAIVLDDGAGQIQIASNSIYPNTTELTYVKGVTSAIQTQLNAKAPLASPTFTGTVVLPSTTSIGTVSSTEIGYLDNVTSNIQTQFSGKQPLATNLTSLSGLTYSAPAFVKMTGANTFALDTSTYLTSVGIANLTATGTPSATTYLRGDNTWATAGGTITLSAIGTDATANANGATITGSVLNLQPATAGFGGVVTTGVQTFAGAKTFSSSPKAPTPTIGTNDTTLATTAFVNASVPGSIAYNILIGNGTGMGNIDTQTTGTSGGNSYPQNGRNVMINNGATAITITANTLLTATDFIASYTKVGTANITFSFTGTGRVEVIPNGLALSGSEGSTALLTKYGNIFYLLINNLI